MLSHFGNAMSVASERLGDKAGLACEVRTPSSGALRNLIHAVQRGAKGDAVPPCRPNCWPWIRGRSTDNCVRAIPFVDDLPQTSAARRRDLQI